MATRPSVAWSHQSDAEDATSTSGGGTSAAARVLQLAPGESFGRRYRITRLIGTGGMGAVYEAWDHELGEPVALKVIRPDVVSDPVSARKLEHRFKQELMLGRRVTHKNVVRIHDLGDMDGMKYITMPFIDGCDLARKLAGEGGTLPIRRALAIARSALSGLVAAHEAGVIHRDLKPANIMVDGHDEAFIADFGIARSVADGSDAGVRDLGERVRASGWSDDRTAPGTVVGTVQYMAPEQARAQPVDQRADVYAFGLIMFDMLAGAYRSRRSPSALEELTSRMGAPLPAVRSIDPAIPEALGQIVDRSVQPDPAARFQTSRELQAALTRLDVDGRLLPVERRVTPLQLAATLVAVVVALVGGWWVTRPPVDPEVRSFLVTNLENQSGNALFDGAVEEALSIALEEAAFLTAYTRTDALRVAQQIGAGERLDESVGRLIAVREGIDVVLTGGITRDGPAYQVTVQAVDPARDASEGAPLAAARATAATEDAVLEAVVRLAGTIRGELGDANPASGMLAQAETFTAGSLNAMRAYARAQELFYQGDDEEALRAYTDAIRYDPNFGRAYAGMAGIYQHRQQQADMEGAYEQALQHLDRMTERERYRTLGAYYMLVARNYETAIENYEELVRRYPADNTGHANLALAYLFVRDMDKAMIEGRRAIEIYPGNRLQRANYASYAMYAGDYDTSRAESRTVLADLLADESAVPRGAVDIFALLTLARAESAAGAFDEAGRTYARLETGRGVAASLARLGRADTALYRGRPREAVDVLRTGIEADRVNANPEAEASKQVMLAEASLALGDRGRAIEAARAAIGQRRHESILFPAARVLIEAGELDTARGIASELENMLQSQTASYAHLLEGEIALQQNRLPQAIEALREGQQRLDSWFAHFLLGKARLAAGQAVEALGEFQTCLDRQGEVTDVFIDDKATLHYLPPVSYWLARAHEAIGGRAAARQHYQRYLDLRADADFSDPLSEDARSRLAGLEG